MYKRRKKKPKKQIDSLFMLPEHKWSISPAVHNPVTNGVSDGWHRSVTVNLSGDKRWWNVAMERLWLNVFFFLQQKRAQVIYSVTQVGVGGSHHTSGCMYRLDVTVCTTCICVGWARHFCNWSHCEPVYRLKEFRCFCPICFLRRRKKKNCNIAFRKHRKWPFLNKTVQLKKQHCRGFLVHNHIDFKMDDCLLCINSSRILQTSGEAVQRDVRSRHEVEELAFFCQSRQQWAHVPDGHVPCRSRHGRQRDGVPGCC